ncbi:uncharacterized protein LOC116182725 [Photinus pyralis]|uniref:uncharacterized protein LOC116182725 n=1 Tax=Photinus pyralis TaxID=7054 RepID=UPI00126740B8|nr:uncharacterized protein LOC116182725 [Photinus pyralis]
MVYPAQNGGVFWPPYNELGKFHQAVKKGEAVNESTWELCKVKRTFYNCDDFEKINEKLNLAKETSDVQSETENFMVKRRKIKARKLYDNSTDDEEDVDVGLKRPPQIQKPICKKKENCVRTVNDNEIVQVVNTPTSSVSTRDYAADRSLPIELAMTLIPTIALTSQLTAAVISTFRAGLFKLK